MDLVDSKYIGLVSSRLQKFKRVKQDLYNFRCPICGDSQKNKNKARGYMYVVKNNTNFKCHNCGASLSLNNFLKKVDPTLHKQYTLEKFKEGHAGGRNFVVEEPVFEFKKPVFKKKLNLPKATENEVARNYLVRRKLDPEKFYFTDKFKEWTNTQKQTFDSTYGDDARIIIPMYDQEKNLIGYQGRALDSSPNKYITIMIQEDAPKIYGLETIDQKLPIYVVEGPFDSTFIDNSVLCVVVTVTWVILREAISFLFTIMVSVIEKLSVGLEDASKEIKESSSGPSSIEEKDINDMVLAGHDVMDVLKCNTFSGLEAKIKFNTWKKV